MNAKAALCMALLEGRVLNVRNCAKEIGLSNAAREVSRMIEKPFQVVISRQHMTGKSRYGQPISWTNYRLNRSAEYNQIGIEKMRQYIKAHTPSEIEAKTEKELKLVKQLNLL